MLDLTNKANVDYSDTNCNTDYVLIPGGSLTGLNQDKRFSLDRFCGTTLGVCGILNPTIDPARVLTLSQDPHE